MRIHFRPEPDELTIYLHDETMVIQFGNQTGDIFVLELDAYSCSEIFSSQDQDAADSADENQIPLPF